MNIISGNSWKYSDIVEGALLPSALSLALSLHSRTLPYPSPNPHLLMLLHPHCGTVATGVGIH